MDQQFTGNSIQKIKSVVEDGVTTFTVTGKIRGRAGVEVSIKVPEEIGIIPAKARDVLAAAMKDLAKEARDIIKDPELSILQKNLEDAEEEYNTFNKLANSLQNSDESEDQGYLRELVSETLPNAAKKRTEAFEKLSERNSTENEWNLE